MFVSKRMQEREGIISQGRCEYGNRDKENYMHEGRVLKESWQVVDIFLHSVNRNTSSRSSLQGRQEHGTMTLFNHLIGESRSTLSVRDTLGCVFFMRSWDASVSIRHQQAFFFFFFFFFAIASILLLLFVLLFSYLLVAG